MYIVRDAPKSGVEIMDIMEGNLQGWWRPSPGSIYPMLKSMVSEGVLSRSADDKYSLTEEGRAEIERPFLRGDGGTPQPRTVGGAIEVISSYTSYLEDLSRAKDADVLQNTAHIRELSERLAKVGRSA